MTSRIYTQGVTHVSGSSGLSGWGPLMTHSGLALVAQSGQSVVEQL